MRDVGKPSGFLNTDCFHVEESRKPGSATQTVMMLRHSNSDGEKMSQRGREGVDVLGSPSDARKGRLC